MYIYLLPISSNETILKNNNFYDVVNKTNNFSVPSNYKIIILYNIFESYGNIRIKYSLNNSFISQEKYIQLPLIS